MYLDSSALWYRRNFEPLFFTLYNYYSNYEAETTTTVMATKTSLKKWICAASNFNALIPSCLIGQTLANFSGAEF